MPIDKPIIIQLLQELQSYIYDIEHMHFGLVDLEQNRDVQHLINHRLHTAVEICIDIAMHVAASLELPGRDNAVDVIQLLGKHKVLTLKLATSFQKAPKLRNLLVHGYARVDYKLLFRDLKSDLVELKEFAQQINIYIDQNI